MSRFKPRWASAYYRIALRAPILSCEAALDIDFREALPQMAAKMVSLLHVRNQPW